MLKEPTITQDAMIKILYALSGLADDEIKGIVNFIEELTQEIKDGKGKAKR